MNFSRDEAVRNSIQALGIENVDPKKIVSRDITLTEECAPFVGGKLKGTKTMLLEFKSIQLTKQNKDRSPRNAFLNDISVVIDPQSGNPLKFATRWPSTVATIAPYPTVDEVERQMLQSEIRYTGIPTTPPKVPLADILNDAIPWSRDVKQVLGYYVLESTPSYKDKAVWVVELRGFAPLNVPVPPGASADDIPKDARNHMRSVFDAQTGKRIYSETSPQPIPARKGDDLTPVEERY